jgi:transcriptional regulator with XRE-family HTH domain
MSTGATRMVVRRVLDEAPFSMRQLAEESGLSHDAIRSWAAERRTPRADNLRHLAEALAKRAALLGELARELHQAADAAEA